MASGVRNWNFNNVVSLLKDNGFQLNHIKGSHYFYVAKINGKMRQVCVPKHGKQAFKPRTLKGMVAQSGLSQEDWGIAKKKRKK